MVRRLGPAASPPRTENAHRARAVSRGEESKACCKQGPRTPAQATARSSGSDPLGPVPPTPGAGRTPDPARPTCPEFPCPSALEHRAPSSAEADSRSSARHRGASCTAPSSAPQERLAGLPLPRQPTRLPHHSPRLRSPAAAQAVGSCSLRLPDWGRGRRLPRGPARDAECFGLGGGADDSRETLAWR